MRILTEVRRGAPLSMVLSAGKGSIVLDGIPAGYVQMAVHPEGKKLLVRPCRKKDLGAALTVPDEYGQNKAVVNGCEPFLRGLFSMMRWDERQNRMLTTTDYLPEENGWVFDLTDSEMLVMGTQMAAYTLRTPARQAGMKG